MLSRYDDAEGKFSPDQIADKIEDFEESVSGKLTNAPTGRFLIAAGIFGALVIPCGLPAAGAIALPFLVNAVKKALRNGHQAEYVAKTGIFCHLLSRYEIAQLIRFTGRKFIVDQCVQAHVDGMKLTGAAIELVELVEGELTPTSFDEVKKAFAPEPQKELAAVGNKTRLGAVDVQVEAVQPSTEATQTFDWTRLNREYNDFPHLFLLGKTGAGKSYISDRLVRFLDGFAIVITPKRMPTDFQGLQVIGLPYDYNAIHQAVTALEALMKQREAEMQATGKTDFPPINVILDELPVSSAGCKDADLDLLKPLKALIRAGRTSKIRLIILAQGQEVKALGIEGEGGLRDSLTYVYLKGFVEEYAAKHKIDIAGIDRPCIIDGQIADTAFLKQFENTYPDGLKLDTGKARFDSVKEQFAASATPEVLERMFNAPSAEHEAEEDASEVASSRPQVHQTFPNWGEKSIEVASAIVDYLSTRPDKDFTPGTIKQSVNRRIKDDAALPTEKIKKLLDLLVGAQLLTESNGKYSAASTTDEYDF